MKKTVNPTQDGPFRRYSWLRGQNFPLPKIGHTYPTLMKLGTIIPYLNKIQKIYESRDTPLEFCWHQQFFHWKSPDFAITRNTDIDCILVHNL